MRIAELSRTAEAGPRSRRARPPGWPEDEPGVGPARPIALLLLAALAFLTAAELARALAVLRMPWEVMYGESIIYDQAQRLLRHEPLYMPLDRPPFSVAAYTPLYYWIVAALQATVGPGFLPGRIVSVAASLVAASLAGWIAWRRTGDRLAGPFAALLFLGLGVPGVYPVVHLPEPYPSWLEITYPNVPWLSLYKEDVLAIALSAGSVALLLGGRGRRWLVAAGLVAGLAFLTKQTTIAPIVAGSLWLWGRDRRQAVLFALAVGLPIVVISAALELTSGGAYLANTAGANANPFSREALQLNLGMLALFQAGPLALALLWLVARLSDGFAEPDRLLALYWGGSILPLVGMGKVGSNHNHWLELALATSVLATLALWGLAGQRWCAMLASLLLAAHLAAVVPLVDVESSLGYSGPEPVRVDEFARLIERVRSEPGDVLANPLDVIVLAGRPILLEPYLFSIFERQGLWRSDPIVERICGRAVGMVVTDQPLELINPGYHGYTHWPGPVYDAIRQTMVRESVTAGRYIYTPRQWPIEEAATCDRVGR